MTFGAANFSIVQRRTVGFGLGFGIFMVPVVFAWLLLRQGYSVRARVISFGWMAVLVMLAASSGGSVDHAVPAANPSTATSPIEQSKWGYHESNDELHGAAQVATLQSDNRERFKGFVIGSLLDMTMVATRDGALISFNPTKGGTFMCSGANDFTIKLDDSAPMTFGCHGSDAMTGIAYLDGAEALVEQMRHSKRMIVEANFFVDGRKRFIFTTAGLKEPSEWK